MREFGVVDKKFVRVHTDIGHHPRHRRNLNTVAALVADLQDGHSLADLRVLQRKLLGLVSSAEKEQREAQARKDAVGRAHRAVVARGKSEGSIDKARL